MSRTLLLALMIGLAAAAATPASRAGAEPDPPVAIGGILPDAVLHGLNGPDRPLSQFRGRPLIINVWASWCGPCRQEMASLERLAWLDPARSYAIIGISTDDYPDKALAFMKGANATISHYLDRDLRMEHLLGATHLPLTVLVGADGRVLDKTYGSREWDDADALWLIDKFFKKKAPP